jgi:hypothetical protein
MAGLKTKKTAASAAAFLDGLPEARRADARKVAAMMKRATGAGPKLWGSSIVGFGSRTLRYSSGRELEWMLVGFSPRKAALVLYLAGDWTAKDPLLAKLGKHQRGKGCLYVRSLDEVDEKVLAQVVNRAVKAVRAR